MNLTRESSHRRPHNLWSAVGLGISNLISYQQIEPYAHLDNDAIVSVVRSLTRIDIQIDELRRFLREQSIWKKDVKTDTRTLGKIGQAITDMDMGADAIDLLADLEAVIYEESFTHLATASSHEVAQRVSAAVNTLESLGVIDATDVAGLYGLGGGRPYKDVTTDTIQSLRDAHVIEQVAYTIDQMATKARDAAWAAFRAGRSAAEVRAAAEAAWSGS